MLQNMYAVASAPWMILAPLNLLKLLLNTPSPTAHLWVPKASELCQASCAIARMWATLFWANQFVWALANLYVHHNRRQDGLIVFGAANKAVVGLLLLLAYAQGVIHWPIGLVGALFEWANASLFVIDLLVSYEMGFLVR